MFTLGQLNDSTRLYSYGEKALAANPNSMPTLLLLANAYVEDSRAGSVAKAVTYSQKVVELAKANAPDADRSRKLSAGVAHSTLGYAFMKQDKTAAAVPELKTAAGLLKGQDDTAYATALYRLGYAIREAEPRGGSKKRFRGGGKHRRSSPEAISGIAGEGERREGTCEVDFLSAPRDRRITGVL